MVYYGNNPKSGFNTQSAEQPLFTGQSRRRSASPDARKRQIIVDGIFFNSIRDAAATMGINEKTLAHAVRNRAWRCKDHILVYT